MSFALKSILGIIFGTLIGHAASAAIIAQKSSGSWSINNPTRVIIASKGLMFTAVAYQQAKIYQDLYPQDQILFITNLPTTEAYKNTKQQQLTKDGFIITEESSAILNSQYLVKTLLAKTANIHSLDIISHNGVELGPWLEDGSNRLDFKNEKLMSSLKPLFAAHAWARIQGCNSGWNVARYLSQFWNVPVIGSFTATAFYQLNSQGRYELYSEQNNKNRALVDTWSFNGQNKKCPEGGCFVLKPEASPYHFHVHQSPNAAWLPMNKPICNTTISADQCKKALATSLLTQIDSVPRAKALHDKKVFSDLVFRSVCGAYSSASAQDECIKNLKNTYSQKTAYFPYKRGTMLECKTLRACEFKQISIDLRVNSQASTGQLINQYIDAAFVGFDLLNN